MAAILRNASRLENTTGECPMMPRFAVVGHPNKGKSSIVATLAHDDRIAVSAESGTTVVSESVVVKAENATFMLTDTPGFQRPTRALEWLQGRADSADQRAQAVRQFVDDKSCQDRFPDEVQLLKPIVDGAAILYVVDGSRPYGREYEAEMEILRWTGQASMALVNPIENENHIEDWQQALGQYFKIVKVFNPMQADFGKQLSILEAFSLLVEDWRGSLGQFVEESRQSREDLLHGCTDLLADLLQDMCFYELSEEVSTKSQAEALAPALEQRFYSWLKQREERAHEDLKQLLGFRQLNSEIRDLPIDGELFDTEKWVLWGLNRQQLAVAAGLGGAAAGALVDVGFAGLTFGIGTLSGSLLAGGSAWLNADRIADYKLKGLPLGGYEARQGPISSRNFPYVLLGRFLFLAHRLQHRTHARRDVVQIEQGDMDAMFARLTPQQKKSVHQAMTLLCRQKPAEDLADVLHPLVLAQSD
jgi:hypothetical protein